MAVPAHKPLSHGRCQLIRYVLVIAYKKGLISGELGQLQYIAYPEITSMFSFENNRASLANLINCLLMFEFPSFMSFIRKEDVQSQH